MIYTDTVKTTRQRLLPHGFVFRIYPHSRATKIRYAGTRPKTLIEHELFSNGHTKTSRHLSMTRNKCSRRLGNCSLSLSCGYYSWGKVIVLLDFLSGPNSSIETIVSNGPCAFEWLLKPKIELVPIPSENPRLRWVKLIDQHHHEAIVPIEECETYLVSLTRLPFFGWNADFL